ncbi:hypothetical protein GE09DRAFT_1228738 [Coniochaeta sp. 2T2.1]|nr:hypothetical protein GE09DRAFT_1228738 [Coniochaeta sp. 2T2.1]
MTNFIRMNAGSDFNGIIHKDELIVRKWISAHIAFILLCMLLLGATIIQTRMSVLRSLAWKSSTSAVLHALSPALQRSAKGISMVSETMAFDSSQLVRLCQIENEGWRLVPEGRSYHDGSNT